ncbi:uncharacterized protein M421DRAFT_95101 [Didymella exigua CBS 183.55]|uniref:Uncharacterized protein n=1 Tax=Didymella exigua CBS 183.55 TaxID=1150837 RepID=A0A6A5RCN6_9PLEO|nr:uncharacterized protein M421DRAFT_95101 [Didymella exigua CBS 183.55]KAF1924958.1 hypothetical protein M421DRAFT_95101 [Didymella exigua CBS 183.55]
MRVSKITLLLAVLPAAFAAPAAPAMVTEADCQLGNNKCDDINGAVMICGTKSWFSAETCAEEGACQVGPAGNAFCAKKPECTPGTSQCDAAFYVSKTCNDKGIWETNRKCSKPGCCEIQNGQAVCKTECGAGLQPPVPRSSPKTALDWPKAGDKCRPNGSDFCSFHDKAILECVAIGIFTLKKTCKKGCAYENFEPIRPYCK